MRRGGILFLVFILAPDDGCVLLCDEIEQTGKGNGHLGDVRAEGLYFPLSGYTIVTSARREAERHLWWMGLMYFDTFLVRVSRQTKLKAVA